MANPNNQPPANKGQSQDASAAGQGTPVTRGSRAPRKCKRSRCLAPGKRLGESNLEDEAGLRDPGTSIHPHEEVDSLRKEGCLQATLLRLICMSESLEDALKHPEPKPHPRSTKLQPPGRDAGPCVDALRLQMCLGTAVLKSVSGEAWHAGTALPAY